MHIQIELPYPLPTWNRILAMNHWQRKKLRDWIHASLLQLQVTDGEDMTLMAYHLKPSWMALFAPEYYQMIRPTKSKKSALKVKSSGKKSRKKPLSHSRLRAKKCK